MTDRVKFRTLAQQSGACLEQIMILFPYLFFYSVFCNCLVRFKKTFYNVKHA